MKDETRLVISCSVIDPHRDNGGRDDWKTEIASAYPELFDRPRGLPECGGGWKHLILQACEEIRDALSTDQGNAIKLAVIKQRYGVLNILWEGTLSARARAEVESAIEGAYMKSAETCEVCGYEGRLYTCDGWLLTACTGHGRGKLASWKRKAKTVRVVRGTVEGKLQILSCRQYDRECDCFVDVSPASLGIGIDEILAQYEPQRSPFCCL
jgi:hypothetical protein